MNWVFAYSHIYAIYAIPVALQLSDPSSISHTDVVFGYTTTETTGAIHCEFAHSPHRVDDSEAGYPREAIAAEIGIDGAKPGRPISICLTDVSPEFARPAAGSVPQAWKRNHEGDTSPSHKILERRGKSNQLGTASIVLITFVCGGLGLCILGAVITRHRRGTSGDGSGGSGGGGGDGGSGGDGGGCGGDGGGGGC
ncbi:hypothetical protein AAF712_009260 [Marasmius tenuissimus]|uniref:Uncharacterized protein n=1 Tax=Marasmius tenuissimus TaxID=585030 RepID=A0ABR2ZRC9_9AGAR